MNDDSIIGHVPDGQGDPIDKDDLKPLNRLFGDNEEAEDIYKNDELFNTGMFNAPLSEAEFERMKKSMAEIPPPPTTQQQYQPPPPTPPIDMARMMPGFSFGGKSQVEQDIISMFMSELVTERHRKRDIGLILSDVGMNLTLNTPEMIDIAIEVLRARRAELVALHKESAEISEMKNQSLKNLVNIVNNGSSKKKEDGGKVKRKYKKRSPTPPPKYDGQ